MAQGPRFERAVVWAAVGAAVTLVVTAELRRRTLNPTAAALTVGSIDGPAFALLGGLVLDRRPRHHIGVLYLACGLLLSAFHLTNGPGSDAWPVAVVWFNSWAWFMGPLVIITFGMLLLPDGDRPTSTVGRVAWWSSVAAVVATVLYLPYDMEPMPPTLGRALPPVPAAVIEASFVLWALLATTATVSSLAAVVVAYRRGLDQQRQRLRWIAYCAAVAVAVFVAGDLIVVLPGITHEHVYALAVLIPAAGVTIAIVRHRMLDIDRLVARSLSYVLVTIAVVGVYLGAVLAATTVAPALGDSDLVVAISTLGAAAAFRPLRARTQSLVDRRFHRARYNREQLVAAFALRLRDEIDPTAVADELMAGATASVKPRSVSLWTAATTQRGS